MNESMDGGEGVEECVVIEEEEEEEEEEGKNGEGNKMKGTEGKGSFLPIIGGG